MFHDQNTGCFWGLKGSLRTSGKNSAYKSTVSLFFDLSCHQVARSDDMDGMFIKPLVLLTILVARVCLFFPLRKGLWRRDGDAYAAMESSKPVHPPV